MSLAKLKRRALTLLLYPLPRGRARRIYRWLRGRRDAGRLRRAEVVVVSFGKSGRTWLRVMLSEVYRQRHGLPAETQLGLSDTQSIDAAVPSVFFTHDSFLCDYAGTGDPAVLYAGKKVVLLVRDPRDVAVSNFFQWSHRKDPLTKAYSKRGDQEVPLFDFVLDKEGSIMSCIRFLNRWAKALPAMPEVLVVRYEDLREAPGQWLGRTLAFMGTNAGEAELEAAVAFADFEKMKAREAGAGSAAPSGLRPGEADNPASFKTRRGKIGGYRDYFTAEQIAELDAMVGGRLDRCFGYSGNTDRSVIRP